MTPYHSQYWAHLLTLKGAIRRLAEIDLRTQAVNLFTELVGTTSG
jgi:hypothetical protein